MDVNINYVDDPQEMYAAIEWLSKQTTLAIDTETTSLDPLRSKILLLQVGTSSRQCVFDTARLGDKNIKQILETINEPKIIKILHNSVFDYTHIKANFGVSLNNMKCTMLGEQLTIQGTKISASLDAVVKKYTGATLNKETRDTFHTHRYGDPFTDEQILYSAEDVEYLIPVYNCINKILDDWGMTELYLLENEAASVLGDMTLNGIYLDSKYWLPLEEKAKISLAAAKEKLDEHFRDYINEHSEDDLFGSEHVINYNSPKQLLPRLREVTGVQLTKTDAKYLEYYKDKHEVIADLIAYRQEQKKISTYGTAFLQNIHPADKRIHSKFRQLKAQTGRMSSDDPNMMNLPKDQSYRTPFRVQDDSWNFISADFSGQELRLLAHATKEPKMIKALIDGVDLHTYSASLLFEKAYEDVTPTERTQCKSITFALLYGAGPTKLSNQLKISFSEARTLMNKYFIIFPNVKIFMDKMVSHVEKHRFAVSPLDNRRLDLHVDWNNKALVAHAVNQAKNLPFQGAGASTIKLALVRLNNRIKKNNYNARIVNAIHDEILVEVCSEHTEQVKIAIEEEMVIAFNHYANTVPMEVTAQVGKHWIH
jgi:DNA polymerase-1